MEDNRTLEELKADYIWHIEQRSQILGHRGWKLKGNMLGLYKTMFEIKIPLSVIYGAINLNLHEDETCDPVKRLFLHYLTMDRYITRAWQKRKFVEMDPFEDIPKRKV